MSTTRSRRLRIVSAVLLTLGVVVVLSSPDTVWTFDGKGGLAAAESFNSEQTGPQTRAIAGSYEVQPNCAFTLLFPSTLGAHHEAVGACVLVDNAKEFYCIDVEAGWVATAVGKRIWISSTPFRGSVAKTEVRKCGSPRPAVAARPKGSTVFQRHRLTVEDQHVAQPRLTRTI